MNWDWEKLQEKRQRQSKTPPRDGDPEGNSPFKGFQLGKVPPDFFKSGLPILPILIGLFLLWLASGIFIVNPGYEGVVLRFGKFDRTVGAGPHYRMPFPIETSHIEKVDELRTIELGVPESKVTTAPPNKVAQASMFTGDENIVYMHFYIQYSINSAEKFLFSVREPAKVIENAAEAAMREVVGERKVEAILTLGREEIQSKTLSILTRLLDDYRMGVRIHSVQLGDVYPPAEVKAAFVDVASAREAKITVENAARAYRAKIVPVANGTARQMLFAAQAFNATLNKRAQGEAERFSLMAAQFAKAKDVVKKRMYLDAMETILSSADVEKVVISRNAQNVLSLLQMQGGGLVKPLGGSDAQGKPAVEAPPQPPAEAPRRIGGVR